ncbi:MAG: hypothetical protein ACOYK1_06280 [Vampirovibrionia bacterium]
MVNFRSIPSFNVPMIFAAESNGTLPESVRDRLTPGEQKRLLEIIVGFEKDPKNLQAKQDKYPELMELYYKGIGLKKDGTGTIPPEKQNYRAAFELADLINDAILQDQQNIRGGYSSDQLRAALKLQDKLREDLEKTDFDRLLQIDRGEDNTISGDQKQYQTEKITSYLATYNSDFQKIFKDLAGSKRVEQLTASQQEKLADLRKLSDGKDGQAILNTILSTFKEFKDYSFTDAKLTTMKCTPDRPLTPQATGTSAFGNWVTAGSSGRDGDRSSGRSRFEDDDDGRSSSRSRRSSNDCCDILERILARLEGMINPGNNNRYNNGNNSYNNWNRGNGRNNYSNNCNCGSCPSCFNNGNNGNNWNNGNNGNNGNNDDGIPPTLRAIGYGINNIGLPLANLLGLGNNNRNGCCYPPTGGSPGYCPPPSQPPGYCPPTPYYVGGNTWSWGGANGAQTLSNNPGGSFSSSNNFPYSPYNPINIEFNPIINNNPSVISDNTAGSSARSDSRSRSSSRSRSAAQNYNSNINPIRNTSVNVNDVRNNNPIRNTSVYDVRNNYISATRNTHVQANNWPTVYPRYYKG